MIIIMMLLIERICFDEICRKVTHHKNCTVENNYMLRLVQYLTGEMLFSHSQRYNWEITFY